MYMDFKDLTLYGVTSLDTLSIKLPNSKMFSISEIILSKNDNSSGITSKLGENVGPFEFNVYKIINMGHVSFNEFISVHM